MAFVPTTEFAPCPPFFVDNIYEIFISTAANNNLTAEVTEEVWSICNLRYPYPSPTTTTTTPSTTSTTEKTTTTTTTTTEQTTTSTTQQTTSTPEKTTTTTTEQTTSSTIVSPTSTTTSQQTTTTTPKPTTTTTPEETVTSTTKLTTTSTIKTSTLSTSITNLTASTTTVTSSTQETTEGPITLPVSRRCDAVCLSLVFAFVACILIGLLISLIYCRVHYRKRKHVLKHSHRPNWKANNGRYIPKFPKISKQADLARNPLAFINPTFLTENVHTYDPFEQYRDEYQSITDIFPWNQTHSDPFPDYNQSHYEVYVNSEPLFNPNEDRKNVYSNRNGKSPSAEIKDSRVRHPSIGSHVPKMLPEYTEICPFGIEIYDIRNSGLPKINIDSTDDDGRIDAGARQQKLPRIPLENNSVDSSNKTAKRLDTRDVHMNENINIRERGKDIVAHGLPRTPFDETEIRDDHTWLSGLPVSQIDGQITSKSKDKETYYNHSKHRLPRTPFEQSEEGTEEFALSRQTKQPNALAARESERVANGNIKSNPFSLYKGHRDGYIYKSSVQDINLQENDNIHESSNRRVPYVRL